MSDDTDPVESGEAHDRGDYHGDADEDHGVEHGDDDRPDYDPNRPELPSRAPPLRSTAPQSAFTFGQVTRAFAVLAVGLLLTFGLALVVV